MCTLITGITGLLGTALVEENNYKKNIKGIYIGDYKMPGEKFIDYNICDTTDMDKLLKLFHNKKIDCVIHTAGIANTDICEREQKKCYTSNFLATKNIMELAYRKKAKLIFISTNAVFDGESAPYSEEDKPNPINFYGKTKLKCELLIRKNLKNYLIIRPILMYGLNNPKERKSFFVWALEKLRNKEKINIVNDIYENPLLSYHCADIIWKLINKDATGIYHIAGRDVLNRYEAINTLAKTFFLDPTLINPVSSEFFSNIALRPKDTSYRTTKIETELGIKPLGFKKGLSILRNKILVNN